MLCHFPQARAQEPLSEGADSGAMLGERVTSDDIPLDTPVQNLFKCERERLLCVRISYPGLPGNVVDG